MVVLKIPRQLLPLMDGRLPTDMDLIGMLVLPQVPIREQNLLFWDLAVLLIQERDGLQLSIFTEM